MRRQRKGREGRKCDVVDRSRGLSTRVMDIPHLANSQVLKTWAELNLLVTTLLEAGAIVQQGNPLP